MKRQFFSSCAVLLSAICTISACSTGSKQPCAVVEVEPVSMCRARNVCRKAILGIINTYPKDCIDRELITQKNVEWERKKGEAEAYRSVSEITYEDDFPKVIKAKCAGIIDKSCRQLLGGMLDAKYQLQYPYANWRDANLWCKANPIECDFSTWQGAYVYEYKLLQSHNELAEKLKRDRQFQRDLESEQRTRESQQAFLGFLQTFQGNQVNCTSKKDAFGTVHTNCK